MSVVEVGGVAKSFRIPSVRRDTIREHTLAFFRPRKFEELTVLRDISFSVEKGESFGIMGRNGCGKSTLLRILSGIYQADTGSVRTQGEVTPILQLGLGWNAELTARDNLFLTGTAMGMTLHELHAKMDQIMSFAGLERFVDLELKFYSSGMAARLAYAIAFEAVRDILLLDEIFAVGDVAFQQRCKERFQELHRAGHTILLVSHGPEVIREHCQRAILIDKGRVVAAGPADEVSMAYSKLCSAEASA